MVLSSRTSEDERWADVGPWRQPSPLDCTIGRSPAWWFRYRQAVASTDPLGDYEEALRRLDELRQVVRVQINPESVFEALTALHLAVARAYPGRRPKAPSGSGARRKILSYLQEHCGEWVHGEELAAVSGIGEWARRVRELRVEDGYLIHEEAGYYRLLAAEPDQTVARRWQLMNEIRRTEGSARERILALLTRSVGEKVTRYEVDYVSKIKEGSRQVRELRDEFGWPIESHVDAEDLKPGEYRLVSVEEEDRSDKRQRLYPDDLRQRVFERDRYTCWQCQRDRAAAERTGDRRFFLEVHHLQAVADELDALPVERLNDASNLATFCHACHLRETAALHRKRRLGRMAVGGGATGITGTA